MKHVDVVRTAKIAVGCTLSFLMAEGLGLLRELLELKQDFAERLTVEEIRRFWKFFLP